MSLGFTPRPSLSEPGCNLIEQIHNGVAGVYAPAFVERTNGRRLHGGGLDVSLGFTPRPSLSAGGIGMEDTVTKSVSLGFTPRPSLSASCPFGAVRHRAGVSLGFTPRPSLSDPIFGWASGEFLARVAGVYAPAFVERPYQALHIRGNV